MVDVPVLLQLLCRRRHKNRDLLRFSIASSPDFNISSAIALSVQ